MDRLLSLQVLAAVAEAQSFTAASDRLGISKAMVSKHVQAIEAQLGARLFNRSSRAVSVTEAGETYLQRVLPLLEGLDEAERSLNASIHKPRGTLRMSLPVWMNNAAIVKMLAAFNQDYPDIRLDLKLSGAPANFVEDQIDLALRVSFSLNESLIARKLMDVHFKIVGAPHLLDQLGRPEKLSDLSDMPFVVYSRIVTNGRLRLGDNMPTLDINPVLNTDNDILIYHAVREGLGLAILPDFLIADDVNEGHLDVLLPETVSPQVPLYAVYPERKFLPSKVRCFLDFLAGPEGLKHHMSSISEEDSQNE